MIKLQTGFIVVYWKLGTTLKYGSSVLYYYYYYVPNPKTEPKTWLISAMPHTDTLTELHSIFSASIHVCCRSLCVGNISKRLLHTEVSVAMYAPDPESKVVHTYLIMQTSTKNPAESFIESFIVK